MSQPQISTEDASYRKDVRVLDTDMAYVDVGEGDPIVFPPRQPDAVVRRSAPPRQEDRLERRHRLHQGDPVVGDEVVLGGLARRGPVAGRW
jgi:hypothetical protein